MQKTETPPCPTAETASLLEARRTMEVCNACRYCESFCAVFPAMEQLREFSKPDLNYLANLCHGCRGCYYACQYAPPHEWGINVPATMAALRFESYQGHAWPRPMARLFNRNGTVLALALAGGIAMVLALTLAFAPGGAFGAAHPVAPGSFYQLIPLIVMQIVGVASFGFSLIAIAISTIRFWRASGSGKISLRHAATALHNAATLRFLSGGGHGCNNNDESFSMARRHLHHAMAYGFMLCFAATCAGFLEEHILGLQAPYPFLSLPVLLGTAGGIGLLTGTGGLLGLKLYRDRTVSPDALAGSDIALLSLLLLAAATGLALLAVRGTEVMGTLLAVHLGTILALFITLPYSRMVHGAFRTAALLRHAAEDDRPG